MANNKISIYNFFKIGGVCELISETPHGVEIIYPQNYEDYLNEVLAYGKTQWLKNKRFWSIVCV